MKKYTKHISIIVKLNKILQEIYEIPQKILHKEKDQMKCKCFEYLKKSILENTSSLKLSTPILDHLIFNKLGCLIILVLFYS